MLRRVLNVKAALRILLNGVNALRRVLK